VRRVVRRPRYGRRYPDVFHGFAAVAASTAAIATPMTAAASIERKPLLLLPLGRRERLYSSPVDSFALKAGLSLTTPVCAMAAVFAGPEFVWRLKPARFEGQGTSY
jgi:hypothetical protein